MSDLKAIQARNEMAENFVAFCKDMTCSVILCGGGAIGALRHKFIPWDDDWTSLCRERDYEK